MEHQPAIGEKRVMPTLYKINPILEPMIKRFYDAGLLEYRITMDNWNRYVQSDGYRDVEAFLASLSPDRAAEWRSIIEKTVREPEVEEPQFGENLKLRLISFELQEIVNRELPGYKVKLEKPGK